MGFQLGPIEGFSEPFPYVAGGYINTQSAANCFLRGIDTIAFLGGGSDGTVRLTLFDTSLDASDVLVVANGATSGLGVFIAAQGSGVFDLTPVIAATGAVVPGAPFWFSIQRLI